MGKRELVALLNLSSWCLVLVERPFLAVHWGCLRFVIVVFPDHTHYFWVGVQLRFLVDGRRRDPNASTGSVLYIRKCSMQPKAGHHLPRIETPFFVVGTMEA